MSTDANALPDMATPPKKTFMDLPREVFLMVCAYLQPTDLTRLSLVAKDCYLAIQEPLYTHIDIAHFQQLPRLVRTVTSVPVVSHISPKQRQRWQNLSDAQLRERDITKINITLDTANTKRSVSGVDFARCIGAISRRSNGVDIKMTLLGPWETLLTQMNTSTCTLPDVKRLVICLGKEDADYEPPERRLTPFQRPSARSVKLDIWDVCFSGSTFPDLKEVEIETLHSSPDQRPTTLKAAASGQQEIHRYRYDSKGADLTPFYGLKKMSKIFIKHNDLLSENVLQSLFFSTIIPAKLTHLEIANCPFLLQVRDYADLAMLLERGLPLLQHFKLHLHRGPPGAQNYYSQYCTDIVEHPEQHLCNVVRERGQTIKSLDLALPYVCNRIFLPRTKKAPAALAERGFPAIPREPYETLRERLLAAGYRYRRLICWDGICGGAHLWDDMSDLADNQGDMISWELVSYRDKCASWHVSGCLPVSYTASDVVKRELPPDER